MPATTSTTASQNEYVNGLLGDVRWATNSFTFSFPDSATFYGSGYGSGETTDNFEALSTSQQVTARAVLATYASVANVTFTEIIESGVRHADIRFAESDAPSTAWAYFPSPSPEGGDVWFNNSGGHYDSPARGNYAYATFLHEVGHALGLEHSHEGNVMPLNRDSMEYTVMSYRSYIGASTTSGYVNENWGFAQSLMLYDVAAVQHLYGANFNTNAGDTTYRWSATTGEMFVNGVGQGAPGANRIFQTVWDGGGVDTYDFSGYATALSVHLAPGEWTTTSANQLARLHWDGSQLADGNIANALLFNGDGRSLIENVRGGSSGDVIIGNSATNVLWGNGGNDHLDGREGRDSAGFSGLSTDYRWSRNADGTYTVTDLRAGSPDGTDRLVSIDTFVFRDTTVQPVDQSRTIVQEDTDHRYSWSKTTSVYDFNDALDHVRIEEDDGRAFFTDYDQNSAFVWKEASTGYDAQRRMDYVSVRNDNGTVLLTDYDQSGVRVWGQAITGYDAQGRLDYVTTIYDDGRTAYTEYDQAHTSNVNYAVYHYDTGNHLVNSFVAYDDGTTFTS